MSINRRNKHRGLKGNALLAFITVLLGCAVIASVALYYFKYKTLGIAAASSKTSSQTDTVSSKPSSESKAQSSAVSNNTSSEKAAAHTDLSNALFIGDSLTSGFSIYEKIPDDRVIFTNGLSTVSALDKKIKTNSKSQTIYETAASKKPASVYIMLGSNDIAQGLSQNKFSDNFSSIIDKLKSANPDMRIYVESILPVTPKYSSSKAEISNAKIESFNDALKTLCTNKNITYCDVASVMKGTDGSLLSEMSSDGYHLNKAGYTKWISYLGTH